MRTLGKALVLALVTLAASLSVAVGTAPDEPGLMTWASAGFAPPGARVEDPTAAPAAPVAIPPIGDSASVPVFGGEAFASTSVRVGEPGLKIAPDGTIYVHVPGAIFVSTDGGASFVRPSAGGITGVFTCGCDTDMIVDQNNQIIVTDLVYPNCINAAWSPDRGDTWITNRAACPGDTGLGMDRQWIETDGDLHSYLTYRIGGQIKLLVAELSPVPVFVPQGRVNQFNSNFRAGYLAVDTNDDIAYLTYTSGNTVRVVVVNQGLYTPGHDHLVATTGGSNLDAFSAAAVDDAGNVYVVWNERAGSVTKTMMASSTDHGVTWSAPVKVNQAPATSVFPWIVAGGDGKVGIVYYGAAQSALPGSVTGDWYAYYAYATNAHDATPSFTEVLAVPHKVKTGPICTGGTGCAGGTRTFLDFFAVTKFPDGRAAIAFNDETGLAPGSAPYVKFVQQVDGPRLA